MNLFYVYPVHRILEAQRILERKLVDVLLNFNKLCSMFGLKIVTSHKKEDTKALGVLRIIEIYDIVSYFIFARAGVCLYACTST